jgi:hypothetical protein
MTGCKGWQEEERGASARQKIGADLTWDAVVGKYCTLFEQAKEESRAKSLIAK